MADSRRIVDALVRSRRGGLAAGAALGGLALIGSLAYRALRGAAPPEAGVTVKVAAALTALSKAFVTTTRKEALLSAWDTEGRVKVGPLALGMWTPFRCHW